MPRPKRVNTNIMENEIVEVKDEGNTYVAEPKMAEAKMNEDKIPELVVEVVKPKTAEADKTRLPTPICDIEELSDDDKQVLIEKRIKNIINQTQIPFIPAFVKYSIPDTTSAPPMWAVIEYDHRFVDEAWKFYQTNVREPHFKDFLDLVGRMFTPPKIYTRVVFFNYE